MITKTSGKQIGYDLAEVNNSTNLLVWKEKNQ